MHDLTDQDNRNLSLIWGWAKNNLTDCQLAGADDQAAYFEAVLYVCQIVRDQAAMLQVHEELKNAHEAEIRRLNTLVPYK